MPSDVVIHMGCSASQRMLLGITGAQKSRDFPTHLSLSHLHLFPIKYDRSLARSRIDLVEAITRYTNKPINSMGTIVNMDTGTCVQPGRDPCSTAGLVYNAQGICEKKLSRTPPPSNNPKCATFCRNGQPCTPPCQQWGCANCCQPPPPPPRNVPRNNVCTGQSERKCLSTNGCGWCILSNWNSGCIASKPGHSQCSRGWETDNH
jgi:hypothetical protein